MTGLRLLCEVELVAVLILFGIDGWRMVQSEGMAKTVRYQIVMFFGLVVGIVLTRHAIDLRRNNQDASAQSMFIASIAWLTLMVCLRTFVRNRAKHSEE